MNRYERLNTLLEILAARSRVEVDDIAAELDVSAATIRRDLDHLAAQQLLTRTRGGAVAHAVSYDLPLRYKSARRSDEKQRIGQATAALASRGSVIGLNGGTTATEVARALATRPDLNAAENESAITVVTNALNIASELAVRPQVKLVVTGGVARPQSYELVGPLAARILDQLALDMTFLGVDAIDPDSGASAHHEDEASVNQLLAVRARRVVVVADSSKIGKQAFAQICPISAVDVLVTDSDADQAFVQRFQEQGIEVIQV